MVTSNYYETCLQFWKYYFNSKGYEKQIEEFKLNSNNDAREISSLTGHCRKVQNDCESLRESNERSNEKISELNRKLAKAESEAKLWKTKHEAEAVNKIEELEEENNKLRAKIDENEILRLESESRLSAMKKKNVKVIDELKHTKQEAEYQVRKLDESSKKVQDLNLAKEKLKSETEKLKDDLAMSRRDIISSQSEHNKVKMENEDLRHQVEVYKEESGLNQSKLMKSNEEQQYMEKKILELEQLKKRVETEKDDLIIALDDLECALDKAENKYSSITKEVEKMRAEYEEKIEEKEHESRQIMIKLQSLLEAEKFKSENDMKTFNETIRLIKIYFHFHCQSVDIK